MPRTKTVYVHVNRKREQWDCVCYRVRVPSGCDEGALRVAVRNFCEGEPPLFGEDPLHFDDGEDFIEARSASTHPRLRKSDPQVEDTLQYLPDSKEVQPAK
jgi:hypothetical protein